MKILALFKLVMVVKEALEDGKIDETEAQAIVKALLSLVKL